MDQRLNIIPNTTEPLGEKHGEKLPDVVLGSNSQDMTPKHKQQKQKINKWNYILKPLHSKRNNQQNKKITYKMGKNIYKPCIK